MREYPVSMYTLHFNSSKTNMWYFVSATGIGIAISAVLQSHLDSEGPSMAVNHHIPVLWNLRIQFFLQHDIHLQILPNARGGFVSESDIRLCHDVSVWGSLHDCILSKISLYGLHII